MKGTRFHRGDLRGELRSKLRWKTKKSSANRESTLQVLEIGKIPRIPCSAHHARFADTEIRCPFRILLWIENARFSRAKERFKKLRYDVHFQIQAGIKLRPQRVPLVPRRDILPDCFSLFSAQNVDHLKYRNWKSRAFVRQRIRDKLVGRPVIYSHPF